MRKIRTTNMTNYTAGEDIRVTYTLTGQEKLEKVARFKYFGQITHLKYTTKEEIYARIRAAWSRLGKQEKQHNNNNYEILRDKQHPVSFKHNHVI